MWAIGRNWPASGLYQWRDDTLALLPTAASRAIRSSRRPLPRGADAGLHHGTASHTMGGFRTCMRRMREADWEPVRSASVTRCSVSSFRLEPIDNALPGWWGLATGSAVSLWSAILRWPGRGSGVHPGAQR